MEFIEVDIKEIEKLNAKLNGTGKRINAVQFKDGKYYINADMLTDDITWGGDIKHYIVGCPKKQKNLNTDLKEEALI